MDTPGDENPDGLKAKEEVELSDGEVREVTVTIELTGLSKPVTLFVLEAVRTSLVS